ncbi:MAG: hypothetical protein PVH24_00500 [Candidatus Zixiibacteriota bacterium]|jgi:hypothetical protein
MIRKVSLSLLLVLAGAGQSQAANVAVVTSPPTILNILVLIFAGACLTVCAQLLSLVRGGLFAKIWQLFLLAFVVLALSQIASLLNVFEVVLLPEFVVPALLVLATGVFLYGIFEAKRILS